MDAPHHLDLKGFGYCHQWEEQEGRREPGVVGAAGQVSVLAWLMMKILLKRGKGLLLYQGMGCGVACSSKWPGELARLQQGMTTRERNTRFVKRSINRRDCMARRNIHNTWQPFTLPPFLFL